MKDSTYLSRPASKDQSVSYRQLCSPNQGFAPVSQWYPTPDHFGSGVGCFDDFCHTRHPTAGQIRHPTPGCQVGCQVGCPRTPNNGEILSNSSTFEFLARKWSLLDLDRAPGAPIFLVDLDRAHFFQVANTYWDLARPFSLVASTWDLVRIDNIVIARECVILLRSQSKSRNTRHPTKCRVGVGCERKTPDTRRLNKRRTRNPPKRLFRSGAKPW